MCHEQILFSHFNGNDLISVNISFAYSVILECVHFWVYKVSDNELEVMWEESIVAYFKVINRSVGLKKAMKHTNKYLPFFGLLYDTVHPGSFATILYILHLFSLHLADESRFVFRRRPVRAKEVCWQTTGVQSVQKPRDRSIGSRSAFL
jgi:hypothetical protein